MCVFAVPIYFKKFPLAVVLVNDIFFWFLIVFVLEMRTMLLLFLFFLFFFLLCALCILCLLPCLTTCSLIDVL